MYTNILKSSDIAGKIFSDINKNVFSKDVMSEIKNLLCYHNKKLFTIAKIIRRNSKSQCKFECHICLIKFIIYLDTNQLCNNNIVGIEN